MSLPLSRTCLPLLRIADIEDRQAALRFLSANSKLIDDCRGALRGLPDIEKLMSAIHSAGVRLTNHPENRAVYYEQVSTS
jgi:DNA mismatch repair protein MSH6